jgi:putative N-acetylmannosamine-6-phosphate epimerase
VRIGRNVAAFGALMARRFAGDTRANSLFSRSHDVKMLFMNLFEAFRRINQTQSDGIDLSSTTTHSKTKYTNGIPIRIQYDLKQHGCFLITGSMARGTFSRPPFRRP